MVKSFVFVKKLKSSKNKLITHIIIQEIIIYLEKTKNTEFTLTLVKYLNNQNMQSRNSVWALSSQIAMIGEDVAKIKEHLKIS